MSLNISILNWRENCLFKNEAGVDYYTRDSLLQYAYNIEEQYDATSLGITYRSHQRNNETIVCLPPIGCPA